MWPLETFSREQLPIGTYSVLVTVACSGFKSIEHGHVESDYPFIGISLGESISRDAGCTDIFILRVKQRFNVIATHTRVMLSCFVRPGHYRHHYSEVVPGGFSISPSYYFLLHYSFKCSECRNPFKPLAPGCVLIFLSCYYSETSIYYISEVRVTK